MIPLPEPMKATSGALPREDEEGWAFEIKWDGMRVVTAVADGAMEMRSSNGIEITQRFPELAGLPAVLDGHRVVLDGEVVAFDSEGHASFARMQQRMHVDDRAEAVRRAATVPVTYLLFDLLELDGHDTTALTYEQRRKLLADLVEPGPSWQVPAHHTGDGTALLAAATAQGLEGLMAKRLDSPYLPGRRSPAWRKVKIRREQEVVVVGWLPGEGNRSGRLGALLVVVHDPADPDPDRPLLFAGRVGTGFSDAELGRLGDRLAELAVPTSPLAPPVPREIVRLARWVRPELVAQVAFGEWTPDGRMRHPSYLGLRIDKDPADVVREPI